MILSHKAIGMTFLLLDSFFPLSLLLFMHPVFHPLCEQWHPRLHGCSSDWVFRGECLSESELHTPDDGSTRQEPGLSLGATEEETPHACDQLPSDAVTAQEDSLSAQQMLCPMCMLCLHSLIASHLSSKNVLFCTNKHKRVINL